MTVKLTEEILYQFAMIYDSCMTRSLCRARGRSMFFQAGLHSKSFYSIRYHRSITLQAAVEIAPLADFNSQELECTKH
jgi:hypothetical protein